jgi:hypothetical protein
LLTAIDLSDRTKPTEPRYYNIRWLELMKETATRIRRFGDVL